MSSRLPSSDSGRGSGGERAQAGANYHKAHLQNRSADTGSSAAFLADVDADQVDAQVLLLTKVLADVQVRHDELPA